MRVGAGPSSSPFAVPQVLSLGTRASPLALAQTARVAAALADHGVQARAKTFSTRGDRWLDVPLQALGDKGVFTAELQHALRAGQVAAAVHSAKDMSALDDPDLPIVAALPRDARKDVVIAPGGAGLDSLPKGARVGTSSLRRAAQLRDARPDLRPVVVRGNIQTRLQKWRAGEVDALILAAAGLARLGLEEAVPHVTLPGLYAPAQGIIAVQALAAAPHWDAINDPASFAALRIERALVRGLGASCRQPVACALDWTRDGQGTLAAMAWGPEGARVQETLDLAPDQTLADQVAQAERLGLRLRARLPQGLGTEP